MRSPTREILRLFENLTTGQEVVPYKHGATMNFVGVGVPDNPKIYKKSQIEHIP